MQISIGNQQTDFSNDTNFVSGMMRWVAFGCVFLLVIYGRQVVAQSSCEVRAEEDLSQSILRCEEELSMLSKQDARYTTVSLTLSQLYQTSGDLNSAERILKTVIHELPDLSTSDRIDSLRQLGILYFSQRMYEKSYEAFENALELMVNLGDKQYLALGYNDLANVYKAYGDLDNAAKLLLQSYEIHTEVNNDVGRASALNNLGSLYRERGSYDEAIVALRRAYSIFDEIDQPIRAALTLANLGDTFHKSGDATKAIELLNQSARALTDLNSFHTLAKVYVLLAEVHVSMQRAREAQAYLDKAKLTWSLVQASSDNPRFWFVQGAVWSQLNELDKAFDAYQKAEALVTDGAEFEFQISLYQAVARLGERKNDYKLASRYWHLYASTLSAQQSLKNSLKSQQLRSIFTFSSPSSAESYFGSRIFIAIVSALISIILLFSLSRIKVLLEKKQVQLSSSSDATHVGMGVLTNSPLAPPVNSISDTLSSSVIKSNNGDLNSGDLGNGESNIGNLNNAQLNNVSIASSPSPLGGSELSWNSALNCRKEKYDSLSTNIELENGPASSLVSGAVIGEGAAERFDSEKPVAIFKPSDVIEFQQYKEKVEGLPTDTQPTANSRITKPDAMETVSEQQDQYRQQLVEMMHLALQMWEEHTQTGKLDLAEKSKIWSVGVDDGRLRARAMERYFSINTLPHKPRWRSVVRTCNYVLRQCKDKSLYREELEHNVKSFQAVIKRNATIVSRCG